MGELIDPMGHRCPTHARGGWTGNRGILTVNGKRRAWATRAWLTCALDYFPVEGTDVRYTRLFFLDEASAFAAGHRPCARCRRADFNTYREAVAQGLGLAALPSAKDLDQHLHDARLTGSERRTTRSDRHALPVGAFIKDGTRALLVAQTGLFSWTPAGYRVADGYLDDVVEVLTPAPTLAAFHAGYVPQIALP